MRWWLPLVCWPLLAAPAVGQTRMSVVSTTTRGDSLFVTVAFDSLHSKVDTVLVRRVDTVTKNLPNTVLVGQWSLPDTLLGAYNGTLLTGMDGYKSLAKVKAKGGQAVLYLPRNAMRNPDSTMNVAKAKAYIAALPDLSSYVADGTLWGVMVADDITGKAIWGDCANIACLPQFDTVALAVRDKLPGVRTIIRSAPDVINSYGYKLKWARWSWAQYSARYGSVTAYRDRQVAIARDMGICLVLGINTVNGGDGSSGRGTIPKAEMSPAEVLAYGKVFLPYTPIFLNWEYRPDIESRLHAAFLKVRALGDSTKAVACQ